MGMTMWFSEQTRLLALVMGCAVLWSLESVVPLYVYEKNRLRRALPNITLTVLLVLTNLVLSFATVGVSNFVVNRKVGLLFLLPTLPTWLTALLGIMALDFFTYVAHVALHKSWLGWQFHRVHHSDYEVNVTTAFRQHPGETVWRILWYGLAVALFGISPFVLVLYLTISTLNAQLEHTNIKLRESVDRVLRILFVTPNMHKVHHSREQHQTDTNYSNIFSVWDRNFGTYTSSIDFSRLRYGLDGFDEAKKQTLPALLMLPFSVNA
jgi:sterol desaturase/sphingolipid hydroxylase (fatty acid hydroxylase superfamily)